ncbi:MAG: 2-oxoacid:acceptor oxidoreductase family protein [Pseudomonadota bacterium]
MTTKGGPILPAQRIEIRLAGSGGQGIILAGLVLAEAAGIYDDREAAMIQSYGPEARGGTSKAEIIISDHRIDYPLCGRVDLFLAMTQEAADAYSGDLSPEAWVLVDADLVPHPPEGRTVRLPFTAVARDKLGKTMVANITALGAITELTGFVSRRGIEKALAAHIPVGTEALNRKALALGAKMARDYRRLGSEEHPPEAKEDDL